MSGRNILVTREEIQILRLQCREMAERMAFDLLKPVVDRAYQRGRVEGVALGVALAIVVSYVGLYW